MGYLQRDSLILSSLFRLHRFPDSSLTGTESFSVVLRPIARPLYHIDLIGCKRTERPAEPNEQRSSPRLMASLHMQSWLPSGYFSLSFFRIGGLGLSYAASFPIHLFILF